MLGVILTEYFIRKKKQKTFCGFSMGTLPPNALRRDCNGKCIEYIEGHALEVVVEV